MAASIRNKKSTGYNRTLTVLLVSIIAVWYFATIVQMFYEIPLRASTAILPALPEPAAHLAGMQVDENSVTHVSVLTASDAHYTWLRDTAQWVKMDTPAVYYPGRLCDFDVQRTLERASVAPTARCYSELGTDTACPRHVIAAAITTDGRVTTMSQPVRCETILQGASSFVSFFMWLVTGGVVLWGFFRNYSQQKGMRA